ncbi:ABC transporter permease [Enterococcus pallens]|uniref:Transport permease protein n=1 Tax=Enterococcus pallens ATCC BAA-351 TaxID=1158607 RepID=R2QEL3_9ENTE|nr:ABC transporter permease [Enterococcus pallens]EOH93688.1 hypothetical protein UAU_02384 [Enterococcus pallens ATCC BAA-351]EOU24528.1 hypothetical protein I588_00515 [Enterococcus pallens ATCC BAA-351]OJG78584.1 hypothetical protein RV10_GL001366 [Enterococcus pallens]
MKTFWLLYKSEAKLSIREMSSVIFGLFVPIGIVVLMAFMEDSNPALNRIFASVTTVGICSAGVMGLPLALSSYRERKILKWYQVTPISPIQLLLAHLLFCFTLSLVSMLLIFALLTVAFDFHYQGSWLTFIPAYLLVMLSVHAIGLIIASLSPSEKATGAINSAVFFPMFFLSGATVPFEILPKGLQKIASVLPLTQGIKLLKAITFQEQAQIPAIVVLLMLITLVGTAIAFKFFKWE